MRMVMAQPAASQLCASRHSKGGGGCGRGGAAPACTLASRQRYSTAVHAIAAPGGATPQQQDAASLDVSGNVVSPSFRSTPWAAEEAIAAEGAARAAARIAFVSESGICRCVLAAAAFQRVLDQRGMTGWGLECECRSTRDFCLGEGPDPAVEAVAAEMGLQLPAGYQVQQFKEARDIVDFDVVLVMDKFTAADVLREVSVFDTIKSWGKANYTSKVRRLGEFHPEVAPTTRKDLEAADIGDPLYGNAGGEAEVQAIRQAAVDIQRACEGFADFLATAEEKHSKQQEAATATAAAAAGGEAGGDAAAAAGSSSGRLGNTLTAAIRELDAMDWLVPPMLQAR